MSWRIAVQTLPGPSLDLLFTNRSLVDNISGQNLITFTRASSATYVDSNRLIRTAAVNEPRFDHNPVTGESLGLLIEEQRTNLLLQSSALTTASWGLTNVTRTANSTTAPDGTDTAVKIASTTGTWQTFLGQGSVAGITAVPTTFSCYAKAAEASWFALAGIQFGEAIAYFNLETGALGARSAGSAHSITPVGNGWYRCSVTCASASSTVWGFFPVSADNTLTPAAIGNGVHVWGPQLEQGAFPTSYIPTTTAAVTRAADLASITGANFSSWYRQDEGTVFSQGISINKSDTAFWTLQGSASNGASVLAFPINNTATYQVLDGGSIQANISYVNPYPAAATIKTSVAIKLNDFAFAVNGGTPASDTSGTVPTVTSLVIGNYLGGGNAYDYSGTIARLSYWPARLPNPILQTLTQ
jgi:hypothetical protein